MAQQLAPGVIEDIIRRVREWVLAGLPVFGSGTVSAPVKGWIHVAYTDPVLGAPVMVRNPHLVALSEWQAGAYTPPTYVIPDITIQIPKVTVPEVSVPEVTLPTVPDIPVVAVDRVVRSDLRQRMKDDYYNTCTLQLGDWAPFNILRDAIRHVLCGMISHIGWVTGHVLNWLWDALVQPQIDDVTTGINTGLDSARSKVQEVVDAFKSNVDSALASFRDSANVALGDMRDGANTSLENLRTKSQDQINAALGEIIDKSEAAVNDTIGKIYGELEGLGVGVMIGKAQVANVSSTGFDWLAPAVDAKLHYVVVGR